MASADMMAGALADYAVKLHAMSLIGGMGEGLWLQGFRLNPKSEGHFFRII